MEALLYGSENFLLSDKYYEQYKEYAVNIVKLQRNHVDDKPSTLNEVFRAPAAYQSKHAKQTSKAF